MNDPKKPKTDLAALKARLAQKTGAEAPVAAPAPAAPAARPAAATPQHRAARAAQPQPPPEPEVPAPGQVVRAAPPVDVPAPGHVAAADPEPYSAPSVADQPFGGSVHFNPNEGLIDGGGEVQSKGNRGLMIFAAFGAAALGGVVGYLLNQNAVARGQLEVGRNKGATMVSEVQKIVDARKTVSLEMENVKKTAGADPAKAAEQLSTLLTQTLDKQPQVQELFGWQLASVHPIGVKKVFELYEEYNGLRLDLGYLAGFLQSYGASLSAAGGPQVFAVVFSKKGGATLVEAVEPICDMEAMTPCDDAKIANAEGYKIRDAIGGEEKVVPKGAEEGQAMLVSPGDGVYNYAIGLEPNKNALKVYMSLVQKVDARLEAMNKAEQQALRSLKNYADSPDVDGSNPQPEP